MRANLSRLSGLLRIRIARLILVCNLSGLLVMLAGVIIFGELRSVSELVRARAHAVLVEAELLSSVVANMAVPGFPQTEQEIIGGAAQKVLDKVHLPDKVRVRIFDLAGNTLSDSQAVDQNTVSNKLLAQIARVDGARKTMVTDFRRKAVPWRVKSLRQVGEHAEEVQAAMDGYVAGSERVGADGDYLISVTVPVRRASEVIGILTVEAADVEAILLAQRKGLLPVVLVAFLVVLATSVYLTIQIATPLQALASAADQVRAGRSRQLGSQDFGKRRDEIGYLARSLDAMTGALTSRAEANARFAADVAHELKNPLTSIRSAVETLGAVDKADVRERMESLIVQDVYRMDRLITDISNAGQTEAELVGKTNKLFDLAPVLQDIIEVYRRTGNTDRFHTEGIPDSGLFVMGSSDALTQVFRNLIDNAISFSPDDKKIHISSYASSNKEDIVIQIRDEGKGIPEDAREKIFQRFYSDRGDSSKIGHSGLGLSIADHIVRAHGGDIQARNIRQSDKVVGAELSVRLPHSGMWQTKL